MSNFLEDIETIKTFHRFLGIVVDKVEKGEKVDFKSVSKISKMIKDYFDKCAKENESKEDSTKDDTVTEVKDKFLTDILSGEYTGDKIRKSIIDYNSFKKNVLIY